MATKTRSTKKQVKDISPQIDFPRNGETVGMGHYAVRISAQAGSDVEISFDKGAWLSCRYAVGHWWFDWTASVKGPHSVAVRARGAQGKWQPSKEVLFQVADN